MKRPKHVVLSDTIALLKALKDKVSQAHTMVYTSSSRSSGMSSAGANTSCSGTPALVTLQHHFYQPDAHAYFWCATVSIL
jgi:hypothetical protein